MALTSAQRELLRRALNAIEDDLYGYLQEQMSVMYEGTKPGTTTLDQVMFLKGKAEGAAELRETLLEWSIEPDNSSVPAEKPSRTMI